MQEQPDNSDVSAKDNAAHLPPDRSAPGGRPLRWLHWPRLDGLTASGFESQRYLTKWVLLSTAIGIVAGLGAVVFYLGIDWATRFFLGTLVGYQPPAPLGEGAPTLTPIARPWLLPLVTALGGLLSGLIVFSLAPEAGVNPTLLSLTAK